MLGAGGRENHCDPLDEAGNLRVKQPFPMKTRLFLGLSIVVCMAVLIAGRTRASGIDLPGLSVQSPSVQITTWPAPVPPGGAAPITWQISGGTTVSHSDIHWGVKSGLNCPDPLPSSTGDHTGGMGSYSDSLTMPAGHDYLCFRVHATIDGTDYYDPPLGHDPKILPAVLYGNAGNGNDWGDGVNYCSPYNGICWETDHPFSARVLGICGREHPPGNGRHLRHTRRCPLPDAATRDDGIQVLGFNCLCRYLRRAASVCRTGCLRPRPTGF